MMLASVHNGLLLFIFYYTIYNNFESLSFNFKLFLIFRFSDFVMIFFLKYFHLYFYFLTKKII